MTPEQREALDRAVEFINRSCHRVGCMALATAVYTRTTQHRQRGAITYHYQRCDDHPVPHADSVEPFAAAQREAK